MQNLLSQSSTKRHIKTDLDWIEYRGKCSSVTNLLMPAHQPLEGLGVLVPPPALHEALHLKLLEDHGQVGEWA